jgi:hypothetical protein
LPFSYMGITIFRLEKQAARRGAINTGTEPQGYPPMTQATRVLSTPPTNTSARHSRRSILGAIAGSAAAAGGIAGLTPVIASALPADPIYAAIERHRAESRAYDKAIGDQSKLEETLPEEVKRSPRVQFGLKDRVNPYYLHSHHDIDHRLGWMPDFGSTPEIRARLHAELDRDIAEILAKQDQCGLTAAELRTESLCWSLHKAACAIATTVPTSMAGVAAVLQYANEWEDAGEEWPDTDTTTGGAGWHYLLRQTMAAAIEALVKAQAGKAVQA